METKRKVGLLVEKEINGTKRFLVGIKPYFIIAIGGKIDGEGHTRNVLDGN